MNAGDTLYEAKDTLMRAGDTLYEAVDTLIRAGDTADLQKSRCFYGYFSVDTGGFSLDISSTSFRHSPDLDTWLTRSAFCILKEKGG